MTSDFRADYATTGCILTEVIPQRPQRNFFRVSPRYADRYAIGRISILHAGAVRGSAVRRRNDQPRHQVHVRDDTLFYWCRTLSTPAIWKASGWALYYIVPLLSSFVFAIPSTTLPFHVRNMRRSGAGAGSYLKFLYAHEWHGKITTQTYHLSLM